MESFSKALVFEGKEEYLVDFVSREVSVSKQFVKQLLAKGSVWFKREKSSLKRVRKAKFLLLKGDKVEVHYSSKIKDLDVEKLCYPIGDFKEWGVWFKGVNVLSQGTKYGDSNSILRLLEKQKPNVHMINRIDKEASGLMVFAYTKKMAATLSKIWGEESTEKTYQIVVKGNMAKKFPKKGKITKKIQGKESLTLFDVQKSQKEFSLVLATLKTGRFHQIRKHFEAIRFPLLGDPRYGRGNKNKEGLQLQSTFLKLKNPNPNKKGTLSFEVPEKDQLFSNFKGQLGS
ncbi:RNA pseudouridine synthase [Bacteriovoracales bacterium]|nr:RNA pseudouridine synthase [Bacteriovoracales bacterium]